MGLTKTISTLGYGLVKGALRKKRFQESNSKYFILTAHPDDEILISGLLQRLTRTDSDFDFLCLSDGSHNARSQERIDELVRALELIGANAPDPLILASEKGIYKILVQGTEGQAKEFGQDLIERLTGQLLSSQPDTILLPDYAGVHPVHDLAQFIGLQAAKNYFVETLKPYSVHEFPQCVLLGAEGYTSEELTRIILEKKVPSHVRIRVGELSPEKKASSYLNDPNLGIQNGRLRLTFSELRKKAFPHRKVYVSQEKSLQRYLTFYELSDVSVEDFREVPCNRDFTQPPTSPLLYESCFWRKRDLERIPVFDDFVKIVQALGYAQKNNAPAQKELSLK